MSTGNTNHHGSPPACTGDPVDDFTVIIASLTAEHVNMLYHILTNQRLRVIFIQNLRDRVVAQADALVTAHRGPPPRAIAAAHRDRTPIVLRPCTAATTPAARPPPPPPLPKSSPSSESASSGDPRPSGHTPVKAVCAQAAGVVLAPVTLSRSRSRSRRRRWSSSEETLE